MRISFSHACTLFCTLVVWTLIAAWVSVEPQQQSPVPAFTVASVKQNLSGRKPLSFDLSPGRFAARNYPLRRLIAVAYGLDLHQVVGGPEWVDADRFDILATFDSVADRDGDSRFADSTDRTRSTPPIDRARVRPMLQTLLANRFKLRVHVDRQVLQYDALVVARPADPLHIGIRPSTTDCVAYWERQRRENFSNVLAEPHHCGFRYRSGAGLFTIHAGAVTMSRFAKELQRHVGGTVLDETGLDGRYDIDLTFVQDRSLLPSDGLSKAAVLKAFNAPFSDAVSVFGALEDQLGLKLESRQGPVDVHVIDHVERPTPD